MGWKNVVSGHNTHFKKYFTSRHELYRQAERATQQERRGQGGLPADVIREEPG